MEIKAITFGNQDGEMDLKPEIAMNASLDDEFRRYFTPLWKKNLRLNSTYAKYSDMKKDNKCKFKGE